MMGDSDLETAVEALKEIERMANHEPKSYQLVAQQALSEIDVEGEE